MQTAVLANRRDDTGRTLITEVQMKVSKDCLFASAALAVAMLFATQAVAQKKYDHGATDTEIKIGNIMPYSGPASSYATIGKTMSAYFDKINAEGGINGRKIRFVTQDDGYQPPKTVEVARKLVEQDEVLFLAGALGTPTNSAIQKYMNLKKVPHLFIASGATKWGDPKNFPWTMGWQPSYQTEGAILGRYTAATYPSGKIGILFQNDDSGKDYAKAFKASVSEDGTKRILAETSYEVTDPTVDSQLVTLKTSGADTFFLHANPKFVAQAIRKSYDLNWRPHIILASVGSSVATALEPAGLEKSIGTVTAAYLKDPTDKTWADDRAYLDWLAFMKQWYPNGSLIDASNVYGYSMAQTVVQVLRQCADELTHDNVMRQAANLQAFGLPMLLPGIKINTSPTDYFPIKQMQMARFDGKAWTLMGNLINQH
jgi:branched-chain amino acid transport system substrate-binding protein